MPFEELKLIDPLLRAVHEEGYVEPSPIQQQAIPHVLEGRDLLGCAQTGTGKTAAFALPILQRLSQLPKTTHRSRLIRALILAPTRELATQIGESFETYGKYTGLRQVTIFGGVGQNPQIEKLRASTDILVATPGRLLDLMGQGFVKLEHLQVFVLDEADHMLDMGFIHDVRRIIKAIPTRRQTLLFSATMPESIMQLAESVLTDPVKVTVTPVASTVETIRQSIYFVEKGEKPQLLQYLLRDQAITRVLVFTRTKHGANKVVSGLDRVGIHAEAIHGNKSQSARERALANFKTGETRVLVATDIAARGIDVDNVSHVINFDLPNEPETYVHRIGRTGRAGAGGSAMSFCDTEEREYLKDIERLIKLHIPQVENYPYMSPLGFPPPTDLTPRRGGSRPSQPAAPKPQQPQHRPAAHTPSQQMPRSGHTSHSSGGTAPEGSNAPSRRRRRRPVKVG
jgi:ATP-dependent RNA helicase RhlE